MNPRTAAELRVGLDDLNALGAALVRTFNTAPFPTCSRLARAIRAKLSSAGIWRSLESDTVARVGAMLRDVRALQHAVTGLPGIAPELTARIPAIGDALLEYLACLEHAAEVPELLAA